MSGSKQGGFNARDTMRRLYGDDYYKNMGKRGGAARVPKGFAINKALARRVGAIGGAKSRRGKAKV